MKTNLEEINQLHNIDLYLHFYEDFIDEERTGKECEFIIKACGIQPKDKILDLACGHGRHSIYFAKRQFNVTGIDINRRFIEHAERNANGQGLAIDFKIDDMLNIEYESEYDCIILLFNSFGFLDREDGIKFIQKIRSAIRINGKIFLDIKNRDNILRELSSCQLTEKGKDLMIDRLSFNPKKGTTTNKRIYIKDGVRHDTPFTMQLYNFSEFEGLLSDGGLKITKLYGDWNGKEFDEDSRRIIAVIEKRDI